jgi:farnesyl-diphosphate farnesyltransferase
VPEAERFAREILPPVSRTFALSIRVLRARSGAAVMTAYLLCRIADTLEDEPRMPARPRPRCSTSCCRCFDDPAAAEAFPSLLDDLGGDETHVRLARHAHLVFVLYRDLPAGPRDHVRRWVAR